MTEFAAVIVTAFTVRVVVFIVAPFGVAGDVIGVVVSVPLYTVHDHATLPAVLHAKVLEALASPAAATL